jgi:hypothetical protein
MRQEVADKINVHFTINMHTFVNKIKDTAFRLIKSCTNLYILIGSDVKMHARHF